MCKCTFARNYVKLLKQEAPSEYGQHLIMNKAYFPRGMSIRRTADRLCDSEFDKFVNSNGLCLAMSDDDDDERRTLGEKAESFVHYSYVGCGKVAMVPKQTV